jgi:ABC-type dipeptide/oligopeptide/nickel transport system permease component
MTKYIIRRLFWFIPVLFAVMLVTFLLAHAIPGGPFDFAGDRSLPESVRANLQAKYNLDLPLWRQFVEYVWDLLHLDMGPSFRFRGQTVNDIISHTLPISFQLGVFAILLAMVIGVPAGIVAALKHNSWVDYASSFIAIIGVSIPSLVLGPLLIYIFAVQLGWLPAARWAVDYTDLYLGIIPPPSIDFLRHAILPVVTLGTGYAAIFARLTRGSLLQVVREDYIRTARAKGLRERAVIVGHALRNSIIPVVTILGPLFAALVTGTFVTEQIFGIPGMGTHFISSVGNRDYPVVMGTALTYAVLLVIANLLVDIAYAWIDPRIRYD